MRKKMLFYFGCALIVGGALALSWFLYFEFNMWRVQHATSRSIQNFKPIRSATSVLPHATVILRPHEGDTIAKLEIPRLKISVTVLEGATPEILRVAAGHIRGTAFPGAVGNVAIAAHRDTFFRALRDVRPDDDILLTTSYGTFRYIVNSIEIVNPQAVRVLRPTSDAELTLVTCYPFTYIGSAPKRFIVHAREQ